MKGLIWWALALVAVNASIGINEAAHEAGATFWVRVLVSVPFAALAAILCYKASKESK